MPTTSDALTGDPIVSANFSLEVGGMVTGFFTAVSGLSDTQDVVEVKVMAEGNREVVRKIPGRYEGGQITLKRPITTNMDIWTWRKMVEDGNVSGARTNGSILMYDQEGTVVAQWDFEQGWPQKVETDTVDTGSSSLVQESLTIVYETMLRVS